MRLKVSEILSNFDFYNHMGQFSGGETLDIATEFTITDGYSLREVENEGIVEIIQEMLGYNGHEVINLQNYTNTKYEQRYIMTFEEYLKENNYDISNAKNYLGKLNDCTIDDDDLDSFMMSMMRNKPF